MRLICVASSARTFRNIVPVLSELARQGADIAVIWLPTTIREGQPPEGLCPWPIMLSLDPEDSAARRPGSAFWTGLRQRADAFAADIVLLDGMTHWPPVQTAKVLVSLAQRPLLLAFQQGLYQRWYQMDRDFPADAFLCFGAQHLSFFAHRNWMRVFPVGLPRLDCLITTLPSTPGKTLLFVAQVSPRPDIIGPLLLEYAAACGLQPVLRVHPAHPTHFESFADRIEILPSDRPIIDDIQQAEHVVTTHSTAIIEALLLGRDVLVLPSFGLTDLSLFPVVAQDFTVRHLEITRQRLHQRQEEVENFLDVTIGGRIPDSTERCVRLIRRMFETPGSASQRIARLWRDPDRLDELLRGQHPLHGIGRITRSLI